MTFVTTDTKLLPARKSNDPALELQAPSFGQTLSATFQADNTVANIFNDLSDFAFNHFTDDPDYDAAEDLAGYEVYADDLIDVGSREEMNMRKNRIDRQRKANDIIASSDGLTGFAAVAVTEIFEPLNYIPIAGAAYKTYKTGGSILEGAAKTAALAAAVETGREAYLLNTQETRTLGQAGANIASSTILNGVLGGFAGKLGSKEQIELTNKIEEDMVIEPRSVGAASALTTGEQETIKGLNRSLSAFKTLPDFATNPVLRGSVSESKTVRQFTEMLADTSLIKNKNTEFIASNVSVENKIKGYDRLKAAFYSDFKSQYKQYRKRVASQKKDGLIPEEERIGSRKDGSLTYAEFSSEITKANRRNDQHPIIEVAALAQSARAKIFDPLLKRMQDTKLLDEGDLVTKTAPSWARRVWDRNKINARRKEFRDVNLQWLKQKREVSFSTLGELRKSGVDDAASQKKIETFEYFSDFSDDELEDIAEQIVTQILGLPGGRVGYDIRVEKKNPGKPKLGARGAAKARVYDIPDENVEEFLVNDIHAIVESHVRTTAADAELMDRFGTLDFDEVKKEIAGDYNQIRLAVKDEKKIKELTEAEANDIRDLQAMWEKLRGIYAQPDDYAAPQHVTERTLLAWNYARLLGGMTLSAIPDMARHVMVHGLERTMKNGVLALIKDWKGFKAAKKELQEASVALDMVLSSTARSRANLDEYTPVTGRIDAINQTVAQNFGNLTLMNQWNTAQKTFAGVLSQTRMLQAIDSVAKGKNIGQREIENLASHGIGRDEVSMIAGQFQKHGEVRESLLIANAKNWDNAQAAELFRAAVRKQVDEIIVTPGLDKPLWMSRPGWRLVGQFRSFAFGAMQRVTLAGLQQADAAALNGVLLMITLGMGSYASKTALSGRDVSDDPRVWISEGIDRSGVTGWAFDVNNIMEKVTRGRVGMNALVGGPQMSRYASRNVTGAIFGPSIGLVEDFAKVTGSAFAGDWSESDSSAVRRLLPYQNVFYLRQLFDQMEENVNASLGVKR